MSLRMFKNTGTDFVAEILTGITVHISNIHIIDS